MQAADLSIDLPVVSRTSLAADAVRLIAEHDLIDLVVADEAGTPTTIISAIDVTRLMLPGYLRDDLSLANVVGEAGVADLWDELDGRTIGDVIDDDDVQARSIVAVEPRATLVEVAARMVDARSQVARIVSKQGHDHGFVTLPHVLDAIVATVDGSPQ